MPWTAFILPTRRRYYDMKIRNPHLNFSTFAAANLGNISEICLCILALNSSVAGIWNDFLGGRNLTSLQRPNNVLSSARQFESRAICVL